MKKRIVLLAWLAVALAAVPIRFAAAAGYKMPITFGGYTNKSEVLTNFPVLVVLSNNVGGSTLDMSTFVNTNGWDLRFVANLEDTTSLNYEIESWNTNGPCYVWVQVPTIPTNGTGKIWAKWGGVSDQLFCTTNGTTWDSYYRLVWHLKESGNGTTG